MGNEVRSQSSQFSNEDKKPHNNPLEKSHKTNEALREQAN
jgi:hypothetical protein